MGGVSPNFRQGQGTALGAEDPAPVLFLTPRFRVGSWALVSSLAQTGVGPHDSDLPFLVPQFLCPRDRSSGRFLKGKSAPDSLTGWGSLGLLLARALPGCAVSLGKSLPKPCRLCDFQARESIAAAWALPIRSLQDPSQCRLTACRCEGSRAPHGPGAGGRGRVAGRGLEAAPG